MNGNDKIIFICEYSGSELARERGGEARREGEREREREREREGGGGETEETARFKQLDRQVEKQLQKQKQQQRERNRARQSRATQSNKQVRTQRTPG